MARACDALVSSMHAGSLDVSRVDEILGVESSLLGDPELRVELDRFYALIELAASQIEVPHWGLHLPEDWEVDLFDVLGFLIYTSASVGQSFQRFVDYRELWSDGEEFWIEQGATHVEVCWRGMAPRRLAHHHLCDMIAADMVLGTERLIGRPLGVEAIHFCYPEPGDLSHHRALFGADPELVFDASALRLRLPSSAFDLAMPHSDDMMHQYFEQRASDRVAHLRTAPRSHRQDALVWIKRELSGGTMPSMSRVAAHLNASPRTLQRWLNEEESSFRELCDEVRQELARMYLSRGLSIKECSWLLDFSEPRAFQRAFKRWTSLTPAQWVRRESGE